MSSHNKTLEEEEEFFAEDIEEGSTAYSQCTSFESEPLDLSMPKPWFQDGVDYPFTEAVSFTYVIIFRKNYL